MNGWNASRLARGILALTAVCAVNACRYDQPITPGDLAAARNRRSIPDASVLVDACLSPSNTITISGATKYDQAGLAENTKLDATNAQFMLSQSENFPVRYSGEGICWSRGEILGQFAPSDPWGDPYMHSKYGMLPGHKSGGGDNLIVEKVKVFDYGDGISFDDPDPPSAPGTIDNWTIRNVHIKYGRDDCVENDNYFTGTIESSFLDGCYTTVSSRGSGALSSNFMTISNSLLRLQSMDVIYSSSGQNESQVGPGHAAFWKWHENGPQLNLYNNVFRADGPRIGRGNPTNQDYMMPPPGKLAGCSGNVIVWFGGGNFADSVYPETVPACFTVVSGAAAQVSWDSAVAVWQQGQPTLPADVAPPIVSVFPPPQYWPATTYTGPATLVATAVDDRAVTSVQFKLTPTGGGNPINIGAGVTVASGDARTTNGYAGVTKYRLVGWNSASVGNGTYTLTAVAEDGVTGHTKESVGVPVTVSNSGPTPPPGTVTFDGLYTFTGLRTTVVPATAQVHPKRRCEVAYTVSNDVPSGWTPSFLVNGSPVPIDGGNNAAVHTDGSTREYIVRLTWPSQYLPLDSPGVMVTGLNSGSQSITCVL